MAFVGTLGTADSKLGNIQLGIVGGGGGGSEIIRSVQNDLELDYYLAGPISDSADSTISLSSSATGEALSLQVASSTLSVIDTVELHGTLSGDASSALAVIQVVVCAQPLNHSASSILSLTSTTATVGQSFQFPTSTLSLTSDATLEDGVPIYASASSSLAIIQAVLDGFTPIGELESPLALNGVATYAGPINVTAENTLELVQDPYSNIKIVQGTDFLEMTDSIYVAQPYTTEASDVIDLQHQAYPGLINEVASSTIVLTQEAIGDNPLVGFFRSNTDTLALVSAVTLQHALGRTATTTISLTQVAAKRTPTSVSGISLLLLGDEAIALQPIYVSANSELELEDANRVSPIPCEAETDLGLEQEVDVRGPVPVSAESYLSVTDPETFEVTGLDSRLDHHFSVKFVDLTSIISFAQQMGQEKRAFATSEIVLTDLGEVAVGATDSTLALTQAVDVIVGKGAENDLEISQTAAFVLTRSPSQTDNLNLGQAAAAYIQKSHITHIYSPFGPLAAEPTIIRDTLTLTYPFSSPTTTLILRNPNFNNKERHDFTRINRETRGGTLIIFADTNWPKIKTLTMQVSWLTADQITSLKAFLKASVGDEIGLKDHEGRQWRGIILNPSMAMTHSARNNREAELEFEGQLV